MAENKVQFGLKNLHIATFTDDGETITYDKPWSLRGSVEMSIDPAGESNPFYADDTVYYNAESNQGYTGKLTVALLTEKFRTEILGERYDDNGNLVESTGASKPFAMLFEFDGDQKQSRRVLYNVTVTRPSDGSKTKEDKTEVNTQEVEFTASPSPYTGVAKMSTSSKTTTESFDSWYDVVQEPSFANGGIAPETPAKA